MEQNSDLLARGGDHYSAGSAILRLMDDAGKIHQDFREQKVDLLLRQACVSASSGRDMNSTGPEAGGEIRLHPHHLDSRGIEQRP